MTEALVGRRERKKEETKRKIFEAAVKLFTDKGFVATTVDDLAEAADVAKGTFFNYFPRKEAIVHYLFEEWAEVGEQVAAETNRPAEERILDLFAMAATSFGEKRELARIVAQFALQQMCGPKPEDMPTHRRHDQIFDDIWQQGVARGEFRADVDPMQAHGVLGSVFVGAVTWWVGSQDGRVHPQALQYALPDIIRANMKMVFDGLRKT